MTQERIIGTESESTQRPIDRLRALLGDSDHLEIITPDHEILVCTWECYNKVPVGINYPGSKGRVYVTVGSLSAKIGSPSYEEDETYYFTDECIEITPDKPVKNTYRAKLGFDLEFEHNDELYVYGNNWTGEDYDAAVNKVLEAIQKAQQSTIQPSSNPPN